MMANSAHNAGSFWVGTRSQLAKVNSLGGVPQCRTVTFCQAVLSLPFGYLPLLVLGGGRIRGQVQRRGPRPPVATKLGGQEGPSGAPLGGRLRKLSRLRFEGETSASTWVAKRRLQLHQRLVPGRAAVEGVSVPLAIQHVLHVQLHQLQAALGVQALEDHLPIIPRSSGLDHQLHPLQGMVSSGEDPLGICEGDRVGDLNKEGPHPRGRPSPYQTPTLPSRASNSS